MRSNLYYLIIKSVIKSIKRQLLFLFLIFLSFLVMAYVLLYVKEVILNLLSPKFALLPSEIYKGLDKGDINFYITEHKIYYTKYNNNFSQNVILIGVETKKDFYKSIKNLPKGCSVKSLNLDIDGIYFNLNKNCLIEKENYNLNINGKNIKCENFGNSLFCQICDKDILYNILNWFYPYIKKDRIYYSDNYLFDDIKGICSNYVNFLFKYGRIISAVSKVLSKDKYILISDTLASNFMNFKGSTDILIKLKFDKSNQYKDFYIADTFNIPPLKNTNLNTKIIVINKNNLQNFQNFKGYSADYSKNKIFDNPYIDNTFMFLYNNVDKIIYFIILVLSIIFFLLINNLFDKNISKNLKNLFETLKLFSAVNKVKISTIKLVILSLIFVISTIFFLIFSKVFYNHIYDLSKEFYYFILPDKQDIYYSIGLLLFILIIFYIYDIINTNKKREEL